MTGHTKTEKSQWKGLKRGPDWLFFPLGLDYHKMADSIRGHEGWDRGWISVLLDKITFMLLKGSFSSLIARPAKTLLLVVRITI